MTNRNILLVALLSLSFVALNGCGGAPRKSIEKAMKEMETAMPKNPHDPDAIAAELPTVKKKLEAISLSGCPKDFKDAFTEWRKSTIEAFELTVELTNLKRSSDMMTLMSKQPEAMEKLEQMQKTMTQLKDVARKHLTK